VQQPGAPPPQQPFPAQQPPPTAAAGAASSSRTPFYVFIGVLSSILLAGVVVGIVFGVRGCSESKAVEEADKYVAEALGYMDEVDAVEEDLIEETKELDFSVGIEEFQTQVEDIQAQLVDATANLDAAASGLQKIDKPQLPDWWDTYISLLEKANEEKRQAYQEWEEFITRMVNIIEFYQAYQDMLNAWNAAWEALDQAYAQHNAGCENWGTAAGAGAYQNAKNLADLAQLHLDEVIANMERASQLEPDIDFTYVVDAVYELENYIGILKSSCDYGMAQNLDAHYPQCQQVRQNINSLPTDISFDIIAWIAAVRDEYLASIEEHLAKEVEYRRRAAEVWRQNNP